VGFVVGLVMGLIVHGVLFCKDFMVVHFWGLRVIKGVTMFKRSSWSDLGLEFVVQEQTS
jgi:hypothetical protein